jgi:hypothetical protein
MATRDNYLVKLILIRKHWMLPKTLAFVFLLNLLNLGKNFNMKRFLSSYSTSKARELFPPWEIDKRLRKRG